MRCSGIPIAASLQARRRSLRAATAGGSVFAAVVAWTLVTGPTAVAARVACSLPRTSAHHSEGVDSWNGAYPRPTAALDAVMIFLSFPDSVPAVTTQQVAGDHFPATTHFYDRASYGKFRLRAHPVHRWLRMPRPSFAYGIRRDWDSGKRVEYLSDAVAAASGVVDLGKYDIIYLVADPDAPGVDSDATKVVNLGTPLYAHGAELRRFVTVFEHRPPDRNVLAHETGHVFDLPDLYSRPPPGSSADWDTRVGDWDLMGSQFGLAPEPFAWHKWKLGWLDDGQVRCVTRAGANWYELSPEEIPGGTKLVIVRTGMSGALAIEARGVGGNDATICREGVLLYRVRSDTDSGDGPVQVLDTHPGSSACEATSVYPPLADAPLGVGESYTYRESSTRIEVTAHGLDGTWTVKVTQG